MGRSIYASDDQYALFELSEADKDNYIHLLKQASELKSFSAEEYEPLMWEKAFSKNEKNYSIVDSASTYCGNLVVKQIFSKTPEIGIDLLEDQRNKGIAGRSIRMLVARMVEEREDITHFVLRVSSLNLHSKHMIEKLGAVLGGEEETQAVKMIKEALAYAEKNENTLLYQKYQTLLHEVQGSSEEKILIYFLKTEACS